jgi:GNAT acetyltransferase-like protein
VKLTAFEGDERSWDELCDRWDELGPSSAATAAAAAGFGSETFRICVGEDDGPPLVALAVLESGLQRAAMLDGVLGRRFDVPGGPIPLGTEPLSSRGAALALGGLLAFAEERGAVESRFRPTWPVVGVRLPFAEHGFEVRTAGIAWRELPERREDVFASLSRVHRKAVRRAEKDGFAVRDATSFDEVRPLVDASFVRSGEEPRNRAFLESLHGELSRRGRAIELVAQGRDGVVAALLAARCGRTVFNLFHGRADGETHGASNLLHLRLFERAVELGATRIHTGDAALEEHAAGPIAGITRFKRHLGLRVDPVPSATLVHRPAARRVRGAALSVYRLLRDMTP